MGIYAQISSWGLTDTGLRRTNNEDSFQINDHNGYYAVADGMGGQAAGEVASGYFAECVDELRKSSPQRSAGEALRLVQAVFMEANARILNHVRQHPECDGMGCTAELLILHSDGFALGHVGDSRTYRLRGENLNQLTKDHSLVQQQLDDGLISVSESQGHPLQNVILRAVGIEEDLAVDIIRGNIIPGDQLLLCSDGLTDMVADDEIAEVMASQDGPAAKVQRLIEMANTAGGNDNITAVLIDCSS